MKRPLAITPWQKALAQLGDDENLRNLCTVVPSVEAVQGTESSTITCDRLREAWANTYLPDPGHLKLVASLVDRASRSADKRFFDEDFYVKARYSRKIPTPDEQLWCITGLAGISKSATMAAVKRVFATATPRGPFPDTAGSNPAFVVYLKLRSMHSLGEILSSIANPLFLAGRTKVDQGDLKTHLREWLYKKFDPFDFSRRSPIRQHKQ